MALFACTSLVPGVVSARRAASPLPWTGLARCLAFQAPAGLQNFDQARGRLIPAIGGALGYNSSPEAHEVQGVRAEIWVALETLDAGDFIAVLFGRGNGCSLIQFKLSAEGGKHFAGGWVNFIVHSARRGAACMSTLAKVGNLHFLLFQGGGGG